MQIFEFPLRNNSISSPSSWIHNIYFTGWYSSIWCHYHAFQTGHWVPPNQFFALWEKDTEICERTQLKFNYVTFYFSQWLCWENQVWWNGESQVKWESFLPWWHYLLELMTFVVVSNHKQIKPVVLSLWPSWNLNISVFAVDSTYINIYKLLRGFDYCLKLSAAVNKKIDQYNRIRWWSIIIGVFEAAGEVVMTVEN